MDQEINILKFQGFRDALSHTKISNIQELQYLLKLLLNKSLELDGE